MNACWQVKEATNSDPFGPAGTTLSDLSDVSRSPHTHARARPQSRPIIQFCVCRHPSLSRTFFGFILRFLSSIPLPSHRLYPKHPRRGNKHFKPCSCDWRTRRINGAKLTRRWYDKFLDFNTPSPSHSVPVVLLKADLRAWAFPTLRRRSKSYC